MAARSNPPKFRHDGNEVTPRKRIIGPGAFSHMMHSTYDPEKTANNSNITIFKILNPHINPNIPKVDPAYAASRSPRGSKDSESISQESIASSIKSSDSPLWNPCNRAPKTFGTPPPIKELSKRPTSARSEKLSQVDTASTGSSDKGSRTGRKLLIELEEELFAKTLQLQQAERVSAMVSVVVLILSMQRS